MKSSFFKVTVGDEIHLVSATSKRLAEEHVIGAKVVSEKVTAIADISILARKHPIEFAHEAQADNASAE